MQSNADIWKNGAVYVLKETLAVNPSSRVLVVTHPAKAVLADAFRSGAASIGAQVETYRLPDTTVTQIPDALYNALSKYDVFVNLLNQSEQETPFRVALIYKQLETGGRVGHSPGITMEMAPTLFEVDYGDMRKKVERFFEMVKGGMRVRITTEKGTDLTLDVTGRDFATDVIIHPGTIGNLPAGEVWCAPVEDGTSGTVVVDGSIGDLGNIPADLVMKLKDGKLVGMESEDQTIIDRLKPLIGIDENASVIGELGIGLNPKAELVGNLLEDEKAMGTAHIALGHNVDMPGGRNDSKTHRDFLFRKPTITLEREDGSTVTLMENGVLRF